MQDLGLQFFFNTMKTLSILLITLAGLTLVSYAQSEHQHASVPSQQQVLYYSCPMHPEVQMNQPGSCPKCGMTLQPVFEGQDANVGTSGDANEHHRGQPSGGHMHGGHGSHGGM